MVNSIVDEMIVNEMAAKALKVAVEHYKAAEVALKDAEFNYQKLVKFRQDYVDRFDNEMKHYVAEDTHQGFRSFFLRLDEVITDQQNSIAGLQRAANIQRALVQECQKSCQLMVAEEAAH